MDKEKKLFNVRFANFTHKEMYVMAYSFDDAERTALMVKREIALQKKEKQKEEAPVLDEEGNIYKQKEELLNVFMPNKKVPLEVVSVHIVTDKVYGLDS